MGIEDYKGQEKILLHRESILAAEAARLAGAPTFTQEDMDSQVEKLLNGYDNEVYMKAMNMNHLMAEVQKGWDSAEQIGWVSEEEAHHLLEADE